MTYFNPPKTLHQAIEEILSNLTLKEKVFMTKLGKRDLHLIRSHLFPYIRDELGMGRGNHALIESCRSAAGKESLTADQACDVLIEALWKSLRKTHALRLVKTDRPKKQSL